MDARHNGFCGALGRYFVKFLDLLIKPKEVLHELVKCTCKVCRPHRLAGDLLLAHAEDLLEGFGVLALLSDQSLEVSVLDLHRLTASLAFWANWMTLSNQGRASLTPTSLSRLAASRIMLTLALNRRSCSP